MRRTADTGFEGKVWPLQAGSMGQKSPPRPRLRKWPMQSCLGAGIWMSGLRGTTKATSSPHSWCRSFTDCLESLSQSKKSVF